MAERENHLPGARNIGGENKENRRIFAEHPRATTSIRRKYSSHLYRTLRYRICNLLFPVFSTHMAAACTIFDALAHLSLCVCIYIVFKLILYISSFSLSRSRIILLKRLVTWFYQLKLNKNAIKLKALREDKKKIIEKVMDTETYKVKSELG